MKDNDKKLLIKYSLLFFLIFVIVKFMPMQGEKLSFKTALIVSLLALGVFFIIDLVSPSKEILQKSVVADCPCENSETKEVKKQQVENFDVKKTPEKKFNEVIISIEPDEDSANHKETSLDDKKVKYTYDIYNKIEETKKKEIPAYSKIVPVSKQTPPSIKEHVPATEKEITYKSNNGEETILEDEMQYSQLPPEMHEPLGKRQRLDYKGKQGYWFIPPDQWYPPSYRPPICVTNNRCPTQPVYAGAGSKYADLLEFDDSRRVTPPDNINVRYISEKLNSGK